MKPSQYVYLYRDPRSNDIRYIGKGTGSRVDEAIRKVYGGTAKPPGEDSPDKRDVRRWFRELKRHNLAPIVEIIPCDDSRQATAVEAGLISALWDSGILNKIRGHHRRFTPLGLPQKLGERRYEAPLERDDLAATGAIVVYVNSTQLESDARRGAVPLLPQSESQEQRQRDDIFNRIRKWWQVGPHIEGWAEDPDSAPTLLLGVTGPPSRRWVWGSLRLDSRKWAGLTPTGGLYDLPAKQSRSGVSPRDLDAFQLRGRLIKPGEFGGQVSADGSRRFNAIRSQIFDVVLRSAG